MYNIYYNNMEYYLAFKKKKIMSFAITLMFLEDIILLSEISQTQKDI